MATMAKDPYALNYAENSSGTFGSDRAPKADPVYTPENFSPAAAAAIRADTAKRMATPKVNQGGAAPPPPITPTQSPGPAIPTTADRRAATPVAAPANPQLNNPSLVGLAGLTPPQFNTTVTGVRPRGTGSVLSPIPGGDLRSAEQPYTIPPTVAEQAGAATRAGFKRGVDTLGRLELNAADAVTGTAGAVGRPVGGFLARGAGAVAGFTRGLLGRSTPAGVSGSQAAGFTQPTAANPIPITPTSPQRNIDRTDNSLAKFGLSNAEFSRRKLAFSGF